GSFTIASGTPLTPFVGGSIVDVARGSNGSLRPNFTGQSLYPANLLPGLWFNPAAFCAPGIGPCPAGYGDAGRNIIIGPGTILFNMSMAKTIPFKETKSLEFRLTANNVFNHPNYTGVDMNVNSPTFGYLTSAGTMRQLLFSSRFRF
ncbi:MAG: carboxypeptidase regulatory-like domain-containing protein, partial [Candidatus Korobacteraceae bacterium]